MSESQHELPFRFFLDLCEALGYDPGLVVSMRINQHRVTVVHQNIGRIDTFITQHKVAWEA